MLMLDIKNPLPLPLFQMALSCLRSSVPNSSNGTVLYDASSDEGHLYISIGRPALCSSTAPPNSSCVVCFNKFLYAVCSKLLEKVTLAMEGGGRPVDLIKSGKS